MRQYVVITNNEPTPHVMTTPLFYTDEKSVLVDYPEDEYSIKGPAEWTEIDDSLLEPD